MNPEHQIILQTIGDLWMCLAAAVIVSSLIQTYKEFKELK